jgi:hypothetical protein
MKDLRPLKRFAPAASAFVLVALGTLLALPSDDEAAKADLRRPTLVLSTDMESGSSTANLVSDVEVKMLELDARASGALSSLDELPDGVLVADHVAGQQLLSSSFAANVVEGLGEGFVALSVRLDAERWVGPLVTTGDVVDVYDIGVDSATPIARRAVVLKSPSPTDLGPGDDAVVSLGVPEQSLSAVLVAASEKRIWLVGP